MNNALVVFSGGQDSTTCLFYALSKYDKVWTIGFDYGQRHEVELACRREIIDYVKFKYDNFVSDNVVDVNSFGQIAKCALTTDAEIVMQDNGLPSSFVPARNLMFMTYAGALAYLIKANTIITGVCETDYSGYPDCRRTTMDAMQLALSLGMEHQIYIETPLMYLTKAQTWELAEKIGGTDLVDFIVKNTHTCYEGDHEHFHPWGYGCGKCPACLLREKGYNEYVASK